MTVSKPRVLLVGGPDVDSRIEMLLSLSADFDIGAVGSSAQVQDTFQAAGLPYYTYTLSRKVNPVTDLISLGQLCALFRRLHPTIVHTYDTKPCALARLAAWAARVPIIIGTITGAGSLYSETKLTTQILQTCCQTMMRLASHRSAMTIFYNREDAQLFLDKAIVPDDRYDLIPGSGIQTRQFSRETVSEQSQALVRHDAQIQQQDIVVTMVSRLIRSKGVMEFLQAATQVRAEHRHVKFLLVGPLDPGSIERINESDLAQYQRDVIYLGERRDIAAIMSITDIFVLPSFLREGIPRVLIEAAAMNLPLITTDMPGCREIVRDGVNGFLVPTKDVPRLIEAIMTLVTAPALRMQFGILSRRLAVSKFDSSLISGRIASLYHTLMDEYPAATRPLKQTIQR